MLKSERLKMIDMIVHVLGGNSEYTYKKLEAKSDDELNSDYVKALQVLQDKGNLD